MGKRHGNFNREYILSTLMSQGPMTISKLCTLIKVSRPAVYLHLDILEKQGLIKREKDPDKKGAPVTITLVDKVVEQKQEKELYELLKLLDDRGEISLVELRDEYPKLAHGSALTMAGLMRYIDRKITLSKRGNDFLKSYGKKKNE